MKFEMIKRVVDVIYGRNGLEPLYVMKDFPIYMGSQRNIRRMTRLSTQNG